MGLGGLLWALGPVLAWLGVGVGVGVAYRRPNSVLVFRLAAIFLGFWAVLATTALAWVAAHHGWAGALGLLQDPARLFAPSSAWLWAVGASGAFVIFAAGFALSQLVARGLLLALRPHPLAWPSALPHPERPTSVLAFGSARREAFMFTLLERGPRGRLRRRDVILLSEELLGALSPAERVAVIAHEVGHGHELDGRYLTFFRTLSRLVRWDPLFAVISDRLTAREEFRADLDAVRLTGRPRALARALLKATDPAPVSRSMAGLLGVGGTRGRRQAAERIRRLLALADSGAYSEEPGA